jgi:lipopolysaccharide/colanic/teichoic acid biosynthesis glycosyltransferase
MNKFSQNERSLRYIDSKTKRCFDIIVCTLMLLPSVVLILFFSFVILIIEGRGVFFTQPRVGKNGQLFMMTKLRTLSPKANPSMPSDNYEINSFITKTGRFLRRHRLDELPQIFSVLKGDMSLVGPRPALPNVVSAHRDIYKQREAARPGLTGVWQICAPRNFGMHKTIHFDLYYLEKAGLWVDIKILFQTVLFVLNPRWGKRIYENRLYPYNFSMCK